MKLTYENLDNIYLTKNGNFRNRKTDANYFYYEQCEKCGEPYLGQKKNKEFCLSCHTQSNYNKEWYFCFYKEIMRRKSITGIIC